MLMMVLSALIGGMGILSILSRKTFLGLLIGLQLLIMGATMMFVLAGISAGSRPDGHIFAIFITLGGVAQLVSGYALAIRQFYLRGRVKIEELRSLKQ